MNPNRMTLEELKELKPSLSNPIKLVCDDMHIPSPFKELFKELLVIGFYKHSSLNIITEDNRARTFHAGNLKYYPSFKKPKTPEEVISMIAIKGAKKVNVYHLFTKNVIKFIAKELQSETPESKELLNALMNLKVD